MVEYSCGLMGFGSVSVNFRLYEETLVECLFDTLAYLSYHCTERFWFLFISVVIMRKKSLLYAVGITLTVLCGGTSCKSSHFEPGKEFALADSVQVIPSENVFKDSVWNIWCASTVKGMDGKYHLFYSRWPRKAGHEAWVSHSEIAHAVSDKAGGPYVHKNVVLPAYSDTRWDGAMTHNPYILYHEGKYYLYYIATSGKVLSGDVSLPAYGKEWWIRRNSQRIGLAVAEHPDGPWHRLPEPVLTNSEDTTAFDAMCVTNPAVCIGRGGKVVMLYKAVCKNGTLEGGKVRFSVAFADRLEGPFVKSGQLIFQPEDPTMRMVAEDPFVWYDEEADKYYAIVRDVVRLYTGEDSGGLALMESRDAIDWHPVPHPKVLPSVLKFSDGTTYDARKSGGIERPFVCFDEKGVPQFLFGAFGVHSRGIHREHSFNVAIPFHLP